MEVEPMRNMDVTFSIRTFILMMLIALLSSSAHAAGNESGNSFGKAKKELAKMYQDHRLTFYAGCEYGKKGLVNGKSCGYKARKNEKRGRKIEWEHVVPAWAFGHALQCWQNKVCSTSKGKPYKGRKCCGKMNATFQAMESDMFNLVPAIGELNGDRSNFRYGMIAGERRAYGEVDFEVDFKQRVAEPAESIRGDIARIYFYMEKTYGMKIGKKDRRLFEIWSRQDPVDAWEIERNLRIAAIQGNSNPFVDSTSASARSGSAIQ